MKNSSRGGARRWEEEEEEVPPLTHLFKEGMTDKCRR